MTAFSTADLPAFSTAGLPARQRYRRYRELLASLAPPTISTPTIVDRPDDDAPFAGRFWARSNGALTVVEHVAEEVRLTRSASEIRRSPLDAYHLFLQLEGRSHFEQAGQAMLIYPGDMWLADPNVPFVSQKRGRWRTRVLRIPRVTAEAWLPPQRSGARACKAASGIGRAASAYMRALTDDIERVPPAAASLVRSQLCQLIALAATPEDPVPRQGWAALRAARLAQAHAAIERDLDQPMLTPATVAQALGLSLRSLHQLFEGSGTSVAQHITQRRLARAHAAIVADPARSIAEIAFATGFNDLSTFQRAFKRTYGATAADARLAARLAALAGPDAVRDP